MRNGDFSGTAVGAVEAARKNGRLELHDGPGSPEGTACEMIWDHTAQRQTGYAKCFKLKDGRVALTDPIFGGARLPQADQQYDNDAQAAEQVVRLQVRREQREFVMGRRGIGAAEKYRRAWAPDHQPAA